MVGVIPCCKGETWWHRLQHSGAQAHCIANTHNTQGHQLRTENKVAFGRGDALLIGVTVIWGVNFPVAKQVLGVLDPVAFSSIRYLSGALVLLAVMAIRGNSLRISWAEFWPLAGLGFLGITIFQGLWAYGLDLTTAPKAAILVSTAPVFGALLAGFQGNWPSLRAWAGIIVSLAAVSVVINGSITEFNLGGGTIWGDLLMMAGSAVWAVYSGLAGKPVQKYGALKVMAWGMLSGALVLTLIALPIFPNQPWAQMTPALWTGTAFSAALAAALAFVMWYAGVAILGVTRAMVYSYLIPVFAIIVSVVAFGADFNMVQVVASVVVLAGVQLTRSG
jgi:drug/metabolite transporter (DMT)-like permease